LCSRPRHRFGDASFGLCDSDFTIENVPGGYASYGFQIQGVPGTVNLTRAQIAKGIGLTIGFGQGRDDDHGRRSLTSGHQMHPPAADVHQPAGRGKATTVPRLGM